MTLKDKYGVPPSAWQAMIREGVISCSVAKQEEILQSLSQKKSSGMPHSEAVKSTALEMGVSEQWVYKMIRRYQS